MKLQEVSILVIDDVNAMRTQIQELLHRVGFELIFFAANGVEAKVVLANEGIHLILADWHMQPINGIELLEFCKKDEKFRSIPFLMVTAESTKNNVLKAVQMGVDDYLIKPLTVDQVHSKILKVLVNKKVLA